MKLLVPIVLGVVGGVGAVAGEQSLGHPFDPARIVPSIDSFALVMRVTGDRPAGYVVQTIAREPKVVRMATEYNVGPSRQRIEMAMDSATLAPLMHWENITVNGREARGEVHFTNGHATGAYIRAKSIIDVPIPAGVIDEDAGTALLPTLDLEKQQPTSFRMFGAPGMMSTTRVEMLGIDTVSVPAGTYEAFRLKVMARDTSEIFVSTIRPRRVLLVRLGDRSGEMRLISHR
jgi:hypothetical protein